MSSTYLLVGIVFGVVSSIFARSRGRSAIFWFIAGFVIGPFGLVVALLPPLPWEGRLVECPGCCEVISAAATVCRHCRTELSPYRA